MQAVEGKTMSGVDVATMKAVGYGEEKPIGDNDTARHGQTVTELRQW